MQAIPLIGSAVVGGANNNMQNGQGPLQAYADPGNFFGGNSAQAMDPLGYSLFNGLGIENLNPMQVLTNKVPGFHGNTSPGGTGSALPNLGASSMMPRAPGGSFMPVNTSGGQFNAMANQSAGGLFNPAQSQNAKGSTSSKGAAPQPMAPMVKAGLDLNRGKK